MKSKESNYKKTKILKSRFHTKRRMGAATCAHNAFRDISTEYMHQTESDAYEPIMLWQRWTKNSEGGVRPLRAFSGVGAEADPLM